MVTAYLLKKFKKKPLMGGVGRLLFFFPACAVYCFFSCHGKKTSTGTSSDTAVVVATSSWTAAYAQAAGAKNIIVLAPYDMAHPSEYELRPGDIPKLMDATVIVFAGYEVMTERLKKGLSLPADKLVQIDTDYSFESMEKSICKIAARLGTENISRENLSDIQREFDQARKTVEEKRMTNFPVIVHRFQSSFAREIGFVPKVIFGPSSPEASEIFTVSKTDAVIIIDNVHNPVGQSFKEVMPTARYFQLLNFPGRKGTVTLTDVIRYNVTQLVQEW